MALIFGFPSESPGQADYKRFYDEDNLPKVYDIFQRGRFDIVIQICDYALERGQPSWEWRTLRFESLANVGRYEEAVEEALETTELFPDKLGALLSAHEMFESMGLWEESQSIFEAINLAAGAVPQKDRMALDYVFLGRAALVLGADPATVLEKFYDMAKTFEAKGQNIPKGLVEAHLASGELALMKDDYERAGNEFLAAYKYTPNHPEVLFGLARAFMPGDRKSGTSFLNKVLDEAPMHFGALLMQAESAINYERFAEAEEALAKIETINSRHPLVAAYRAVLAELEWNDTVAFELEREKALSVWAGNPEIDHLIGRVLSKKYRYEEGAESQKRALELDPGYLPAKLQLALDYLRLGRVEEAWPLAEEVGAEDQYNVLAYNLAILKQEIESFAAIESDDFIIRMPADEAAIYGDRVLEILTGAKEVLGEKYGIDIEDKTLIEFYPNQQDFAIRTFGALGGEGLLGVCFGSVVTMNSPGSVTSGKSNWEATLWHEYCHVISLTATKNRMPRWLSEGISVYEERQRQSNWGQRMTPRYRKLILEEGGLTPVSEMSEAFFNAESGEHLMFAYYQSMLVVEYIVENYGLESLRGILSDLGEGSLINDAIAKHTAPMDELEKGFAESAVALAQNYGPEVDWSETPEVNPLSSLALASYLKKNPANFQARQTLTGLLLDEENWRAAAASADQLIRLLPEYTGAANGYAMKARALRESEGFAGEAATLETLASLSAEALSAYNRLLEVDFESERWSEVIANAARAKAINPFDGRLHYCRGCAHAALSETGAAVGSFEKALLLDPANPSEIRFRLAGLLKKGNEPVAKRHLLDALADSPRYLEAHALLLEITEHVETETLPAN
ncbi:MAG: peptidase MA family metallohydrolase [Verrucomicrobiales bacterium]|nr:peptidase MA family metallohydrolase [Verrucomicrobiales bacterium]